jgi:two-component system chemotaxis response regulator CheV
MSHSQNEALGSTGNEFEIIEFTVSGQSFGVNVSKVRQIVQFDEKALTKAPNANANVLGLFLFRSVPVALVDLHKALEIEAIPNETPLVLVAEFNEEATAFLIDGVSRIHRVSWASIQPMNPILESMSASFTGSINIEDREILIVDLEQIIADIDPEKRLDARLDAHPGTKSKAGVDLAKMKIALAEDLVLHAKAWRRP